MISWLYISSINNIMFVLYETNNTYIKKTVGSIHNLVYLKLIEYAFMLLILLYVFATSNEYNFCYKIALYGVSHGILSSCSDIIFCYQMETKHYNIEKINYITLSMLEWSTIAFNYNVNYLFSTYFIVIGSVMIDTSNISNWYINQNYFDASESILTEYDLEAPLITDINYENNNYNRYSVFNKYIVLQILSVNLSDFIIKMTITRDNFATEITIFYLNSLFVSVIINIVCVKKLRREVCPDFYIENKCKFAIKYLLAGSTKIIYILGYGYAIINGPSITYVKAISNSWGIILLECILCHNNITKFNDLNIFGSLVISYATLIFYLTYFYQN